MLDVTALSRMTVPFAGAADAALIPEIPTAAPISAAIMSVRMVILPRHDAIILASTY